MAPDNSMCVSHHCKQRRATKVIKLFLFLNARKKAHAVHIIQESRAQRRQFTLMRVPAHRFTAEFCLTLCRLMLVSNHF